MILNDTSEARVGEAISLPGTEARFYRFQVGDIDCTSVSDGAIRIPLGPPAPPTMPAGNQSPSAPGQPMEFRLVPLVCLLVKLPKTGKIVLMDSGFGFNPELVGRPMRSDGRLIESLAAAGVSPESIDFVLISHLDPDHVGGLLRDDGSKRFPNAIYYASEEEVAFWKRDVIDLSYSPSPEPVKRERLSASGRLLRLAGHAIRTFGAGDDVIPGIGTLALPGHTPGQVGFIVYGESESLVYTADGIVNSTISIETPDVHNPMDLDPEMGVVTRKALIHRVLESNWHSFSPHFPWPNVGRIVRTDTGVTWKPIESTPAIHNPEKGVTNG
jgi:glyoxylase-like metal-dependent hydrolase (beta-lactamase superfamily II)